MKNTLQMCVCVCCMITVNSRWLLLNFTDRASRLKETHNLFILSRSEQKQAASQLPWHSLQPESNAGWTRFSRARSYKNKVFPPLNIWQLHSDLIIFHIYSCLSSAVLNVWEKPNTVQTQELKNTEICAKLTWNHFKNVILFLQIRIISLQPLWPIRFNI